MTTITQQQLDTFKSVHSGNAEIQALTLEDVIKNTRGKTVDWNLSKLSADAPHAAVSSLSPCQMAVGYVVFDVVCLAVGAVGLRATVNARTIEAIARAATPALSRIEIIIAEMAVAGATKTDQAFGVFRILSAIYSGGCLGAVVSAFTDSLTWWDMILYGVTAIATIVATLATDGVAFVAEVVVLLATFGFVASDTVKAVQTCSLPEPSSVPDGNRVNDQSNGRVYLAMDGALRYIPNPATYNNLFKNWDNITNFPNLQKFLIGTPLTEGASLVKGTPDGKVFLLLQGGKRWILSPAVFDKYGFSWEAIKTLSAEELNAIPNGAHLN